MSTPITPIKARGRSAALAFSPPPYSSDIIDPTSISATFDKQTGKLTVDGGSLRFSSPWLQWLQQQFETSRTVNNQTQVSVFGDSDGSGQEAQSTADSATVIALMAEGLSAAPAIPFTDVLSAGPTQLPPDIGNGMEGLFGTTPAPPPGFQIIVCTQATFPTLSAVTPNTFIYVSDYSHWIFWNGSVSTFADAGSAYLALFEVNPGQGWALYDGSTVAYLKADGTTANATLPDLTSAGALAAFLETGGTNSGPTAAAAPGITGTTGASAVTITGTSAVGNAAIAPVAGNTGNESADQTINYTAGVVPATVPAAPHTHGFVVSPVDGGHTHGVGSYAGAAHTHSAGTLAVDATGEPRKLVRRPYFRK